jgi:hypothetical protein
MIPSSAYILFSYDPKTTGKQAAVVMVVFFPMNFFPTLFFEMGWYERILKAFFVQYWRDEDESIDALIFNPSSNRYCTEDNRNHSF